MYTITGKMGDVGIDWITLTQVMGDNEMMDIPNTLWAFGMSRLQKADESCRAARFGGYNGYSFGDGKQKIGQREREGNIDVIYQLSSSAAKSMVLEYGERLIDWRITRLDEQVTIISDERDINLVSDHYDNIVQSKAEGRSLTGRRGAILYRSDRGDTLYVGSRASKGNMYRIYDKSLEYGAERGTVWRFEVERGQDTALSGYKRWVKHGPDLDRAHRLSDEFLIHTGLTFRTQFKRLISMPTEEEKGIRDSVDLDSTLRWLEKCVKKPVRRLLLGGKANEVFEALGISELDFVGCDW